VTTSTSTSGSATITGLQRGAAVYYQVAVTDASNNTRLSAATSFQTLANGAPVAVIGASPASGPAPLLVAFSSTGSSDPDNDPLTYSWNFGDGSALSTAANPSHTYATNGSYTAALTVSDGFGGSNTATRTITVAGVYFPVTAVLDNFNRTSGSLGSSWVVATTSGTAITSQQFSPTTSSGVSPVWDGAIYGANQESYITLNSVPTQSTEIDLMLKIQGTVWSAGHIEVRYDNTQKHIVVSSYAPSQGWKSYGSAINVTMVAGDQLGARAYANGRVEVLRNGARLGTYTLTAWPYYANTGRLGITCAGSSSTRLDNFGGGSIPANRAPVPVASGSPTSGPIPLAVQFSSAGTSDPDGNPLTYSWTFGDGGTSTATNPSHTYTTAGSYTARLTVADGLGGSASATVAIGPGSAVLFSDSPVLDGFGRADGPIGAGWSGETDHVAISGAQLVLTNTEASIVWLGGPFPSTQEAFVRLVAIGPDVSERDLMLEVQGTTWDTGHIEVRYVPALGEVVVSSYAPGTGWVQHGTVPATFTPGDELGAAIDAGGSVDVFQNKTLLGTVDASAWTFTGSGGRIGMTFAGGASSPVDDFGGGAEGLAITMPQNPPLSGGIEAPVALSAAFPNPAQGRVSWTLTLAAAQSVRWEIVDLQGRALYHEHRDLPAGSAQLTWRPTRDAPPGLYLAVAHLGARTLSRRFVLLSR
jgi:PKD repeat protein